MQTWWLTTLGLAAGLCTSISFVPQMLKAWREGDTEAISKRMYIASLIAYGLDRARADDCERARHPVQRH